MTYFFYRQYTIVHAKLSAEDCSAMPQQEFARLGKELSTLGGQFELVEEQEVCLQTLKELEEMQTEEKKR